MKCAVCRREKAQKDMKHIIYTEAEKAFVKQMQGVDETDFWLCKPCHKILSDREQGAQLIKGTLQVNLTAAGVGQADKVAKKLYDKLIDSSAKKPPN